MKKLLLTMVLMGVVGASAEWNLSLTSGWRVVGGANYDPGLKTNLRVNGDRALGNMPAIPAPDAMGRIQAEAAAKGVLKGQAVSYDNGAYINPDYSGKESLPTHTWNWHAPSGAYQSGNMQFGQAYSEVSTLESGSLAKSSKDDCGMPGFTIEVQRNLGKWGRFGLDLGLGFNYLRRNNAYKCSGEVYRRTDTIENGTYYANAAMEQSVADWAQNADGSYGAGTYDGPGALMEIGSGSFSFSDQVRSISQTTHSMYLDSSADYEDIEFTISAKPYFEVTEWFRVVGTLGLVVSRGELDFEMMALADGKGIYSYSEHFREWDCYGIGGLGGMFYAKHVCLGFDVLARFFDDDIEVHGRSVSGKLERSPWMLRVYAGVEF